MAAPALRPKTDTSKLERTCKSCGELFSHGNAARVFCSNRCKKADYNRRHRDEINAKQRAKWKTPEGKAAQERYRSKVRAANAVRQAAKQRAKREAEFWALRNYVAAPYVDKVCPHCGAAFRTQFEDKVYCSTKHARQAYYERKRDSGEKAEADKRFRRKHRDSVRERDRERFRLRSAQAAISLLIMPVDHSESEQ